MSMADAYEIKTFMIVGKAEAESEDEKVEWRVFDVFANTRRNAEKIFENFKNGSPYCNFENFFLVEVIGQREIAERISPEEIEAWRKRHALVPCSPRDSLKCPRCGEVSEVGGLERQQSRAFSSVFYYFCSCDLEHPLVEGGGDGDDLLFLPSSKAELIKAGE